MGKIVSWVKSRGVHDGHQWLDHGWIQRFQYFLDSTGNLLFFTCHARSLWETKTVVPTLQDNVMLPNHFVKYNYHAGCSHDLHSIILSGLQEEKDAKGDKRCSLQPWALCTSIWQRNNLTTWRNPELYLASPNGRCIRTQYTGSTYRLRRRDRHSTTVQCNLSWLCPRLHGKGGAYEIKGNSARKVHT